jgi:23S rRNA (adenine-N6)-dimethyltransferase
LSSTTTPWHTQNFLRHPGRIERLLDLVCLRSDDLVLDLGAGHGELTAPLAERCRHVVAVEKDPLLVHVLRERFAACTRVDVRAADALAVRLPREPYKVVANIPFDITTRLVRRLTSATYPPIDAYLVIQREAALRLTGPTLLGTSIRPWFEPSIVHAFKRTDFAPPPRVDVVFLRLRKRGPPLVDDAALYVDLLVRGFTAPSMLNALAPVIGRRCTLRLARQIGFAPRSSAAKLSFEQWLELYSNVTTRRLIWRAAGSTIMRPARWPPSRRQA